MLPHTPAGLNSILNSIILYSTPLHSQACYSLLNGRGNWTTILLHSDGWDAADAADAAGDDAVDAEVMNAVREAEMEMDRLAAGSIVAHRICFCLNATHYQAKRTNLQCAACSLYKA